MKKRIILLFMIGFIAIFLTSCNKKFTVNFDTDGGTTVAAVEVKGRNFRRTYCSY